MTKIDSLNITEIKYKINDPKIKKCIEYINKSFDNLKINNINPNDLIPTNIKHNVLINFKDTNSTLINSIRVTLLDDIPVKSLTFNFLDLDTNELYILDDELQMRIQSIPIYQHITDKDINNLEFSSLFT